MSEYDPVPFIIEQMNPKGIDLKEHEAVLRWLLRYAQEVYSVALDDWEVRADPDKPQARLDDNWDPDEEVVHDYRHCPPIAPESESINDR